MLYLLIKQTDTYMSRLNYLYDNPDLDTTRLEFFAEQVLSIRNWYKNTVNNLHEAPPHNGDVSEYIIVTKANKDESAFREASPDIYNQKYEEFAGSANRFIFTYHNVVTQLNQRQIAHKEDIEHLKLKLEKTEESNRINVRYLILIMIAAAIGQWFVF